MPTTVATLSDVRALLNDLPGPDRDAAAAAARREPLLTKPPGALGRLEALAAWISAWQGRHPPRLERAHVQVFAGNHGVAALGVSAFPAAVTAQMVANFEAGGAAINQICRTVGATFAIDAIDVDRPTADFTAEPAMSEAEFADAFNRGVAAVEAAPADRPDVMCVGEMGIGNTTAAAAVAYALYGGAAEDWTGPGTGVAGEALANKIAVVKAGVARHRDRRLDPLEVLRCLGGREMVAIAGAIVAARRAHVPVLLDGVITTAAAAPLAAAVPGALDHCLAGHRSAEPGHDLLLERLGLDPLLDLGMRLGEASGAALAVPVLKSAVACHTGMATFADAGVATGSD